MVGISYDSGVETEVREWFRDRGANVTTRQEAVRATPADFIEFVRDSKLLARTLIPSAQPELLGWTPRRVAGTSSALAAHGFTEWLMWHVSSLAALPVWMSDNLQVRDVYREGFERGVFGAFAMSERAAGADWRHTRSVVRPARHGYIAEAQKDYSGNAESSQLVTTFARYDDGAEGGYAFFRADARQRGYIVERNAVPEQMRVTQFRLEGYAFGPQDMITAGGQAFADAVNTLNVGKFNLATASVGMARRALAETVQHTSTRSLFGSQVIEFGQIRRILNDAGIRIVALNAFNEATIQSLERASSADRSFRLMTSVAKSLVTLKAVEVIRDLGEAISARAFESESLFRIMAQYVEWLPRLEGTRYVNMMQSVRAASAFSAYLRGHDDAEMQMSSGDVGVSYLLSQQPLGKLENTSFSYIDRSVLTTDLAGGREFVALVSALAEVFEKDLPRRGDEAVIEARGELFTRCFFGVVVLQQLTETGESEEVADRVANWLTDDLIECVLRARRVMRIPSTVLQMLTPIAERGGVQSTRELLPIVASISADLSA